MTVPLLGVLDRRHPVLGSTSADPIAPLRGLHILPQKLGQKLRCRFDPLVGITARLEFRARLSGQLKQPLAVGDDLSQKRFPTRLVGPVHLATRFDRRAEVPRQPMTLRPVLRLLAFRRGQCPTQLPDAVGNQVVGVLDRAASQNQRTVHRQTRLAALQISGLTGVLETAAEYRPGLLVDQKLRAEKLQRALRERALIHLRTQRHFPAHVERRALCRLRVGDLIMGLQEKRYSQDTRRHAGAAEIGGVKLRESLIREQLPAVAGEEAVEAVGPHEIQILGICGEKAMLIRPLSEHGPMLPGHEMDLSSDSPFRPNHLSAHNTFRPDF